MARYPIPQQRGDGGAVRLVAEVWLLWCPPVSPEVIWSKCQRILGRGGLVSSDQWRPIDEGRHNPGGPGGVDPPRASGHDGGHETPQL